MLVELMDSVEFEFGRGLLRADAPCGNIGVREIFPMDGRARQTPEHSELADVLQRVGNRALQNFWRRSAQFRGPREIVVEALQCVKEALDFFRPRERLRGMPDRLAFGHG